MNSTFKPMMKNTANRVPEARLDWYKVVTNQASKHVDIYLFGVIGGYDANLDNFLSDLSAAYDAETITVYLNTVGGYFEDGLPIYNLLKQHQAHVTVKVMGYALSMGSVIMLAGDVIEAAENALIMIHRAQGFAYGDADTLEQGALVLRKHEQAIIPLFCTRMGLEAKQVQKLLNAETWYTATEAKEAGLIDQITQEVNPDFEQASSNSVTQQADFALQHYRNLPANLKQQWQNTRPDNDVAHIVQAVLEYLGVQPQSLTKATNQHSIEEFEALKQKIATLEEEKRDLCRIIPPTETPENAGDDWSGSSRYL